MLVLFDNGTPRTLARYLIDHHAVTEARARGWAELENGELLNVAEAAGFEVLVTTDKNLSYQQNLAARKIAIVVLRARTLEPSQAACGADRRHRERRDTRQLRRGGNSLRVKPASLSPAMGHTGEAGPRAAKSLRLLPPGGLHGHTLR
jgi:predicted nuclease of predicted toxin-antitoxin system